MTNETVAPLYLQPLKQALEGFNIAAVVLPDGEAFKNWETLQLIFDGLLSARHDRRTTVIALGGGVIGDMAGLRRLAISEVLISFKCRRRCFRKSILPWAARPASIIRWARTWSALSISPRPF